MINLRKLSAIVLSAALVLTSMTTVFAADAATIANADKAATLKDLGLYAGQDANDPKVGLENALTTQDSLIFLAKLFGYNEDANALLADQVADALAKFDDAASISDYAKNVVAYSAANGILSGSTKDGKFFVGAKDTVTAARFATFMLKQMGYTVADYKVSVAKLAETNGSKVDATITGDLTRDSAVGVMYGALTAEKVSGKTVIADIVGDNADIKAKAEKLGLIAAAPVTTEVTVETVKALNCKQIEIVFNQEMDRDSVESENFYEIYDNGSSEAVELSDKSALLGDDGKTVTITLDKNVDDKLTNSSEAKVIIKSGIKAKSSSKLAKDAVFDKVVVEDGIIPTVTKVDHTGEHFIRITFSEPVYDKENDNLIATQNFKVTSGTYQYYIEEAVLDNNVIDLKLKTKLIEGPVDVIVNDAGSEKPDAIVDYAEYAVFKYKMTFNYVKDTSVAVVTVKSAKPDKVVLGFSKPVKATDLKLYHSVKNAANNVAIATTTGFVDEITFTYGKDNKLPKGNVNLFLVNSNENDDYEMVDGYGIKVPDQTLTCEVITDETPPVFISGDFDKNVSIKLTFDEDLDIETAEDANNYEVKNLMDNTLISFSAKISPDLKYTVILYPDPKLKDNNEYQVIIKKAQDITGNETTKYYTYTFKTGDNTAPEVIKDPKIYPHSFAIAEDGKIYIVYSEPMNQSQMLDKDNYMVSIINGDKNNYKSLGDHDSITKVNDSTVIIYFKELDNKNDPTIRPYVKIAPIMDLAGKRLGGSVDSYVVENIGADPVVVTVKSAKEDKVVLGFSRPVKGSNIRLYHTNRNVGSYNAIATTTDYSDEIIFKFSEALPSGKITLYLENSEVATKKLVDRYGVYVSDQSLKCEVEKISEPTPTPAPTSRTETDTTPPVVIDCTVNGNESITITFSERLNKATATDPASYVVKRRSDNQEISFTPELDDSRKSVILIFDSKLADVTEYQLLIKKYKDTSGNENTSDYVHDFTTSESIPPEVINDPEDDNDCFVVVEKGKIFITYSEAMNEIQMLDKGNYQVSIDQGQNYTVLGDDDSITKVDDRRVLIYVKELEGTDFIPYVKIEPIEDLAGNKLYDSNEPYIIENIAPENVYIEQAQLIAKNKIKIVFNKKMGIIDINDFKSTTPGVINVERCESNTVNSDGKTEVVLILSNELTTDAKDNQGVWVSITTAPNPSSESEWGSKLESDCYFGLLDDCTAPEILMWDHDNDPETDDIAKVIASGDIANPQCYGENYTVQEGTTGIITIFFSEAIDVSTLTEDTFDVDGFTITDITAPDETNTVVLTVDANADNVCAKTTVTQVLEIYDRNGNSFTPGSTWEVTLEYGYLTN